MAEVEVGLGAVVGDEHLAVLIRAHRPRIDVEIGVELPQAAPCSRAPGAARASAAEAMPLPREETTPPVMKTYRAMGLDPIRWSRADSQKSKKTIRRRKSGRPGAASVAPGQSMAAFRCRFVGTCGVAAGCRPVPSCRASAPRHRCHLLQFVEDARPAGRVPGAAAPAARGRAAGARRRRAAALSVLIGAGVVCTLSRIEAGLGLEPREHRQTRSRWRRRPPRGSRWCGSAHWSGRGST